MFKYLLPFFLLLMVGCSSKRANVDYDQNFQIGTLLTFTIVHENSEDQNTLNDERIKEAIINEMKLKGYANSDQQSADFYITFKSSITKDVPSNVGFGLGLGTFTRGMGLSVGTVHSSSRDKENLLINMLDTKTKKTFWSSSLTQNINSFESPQESTEYYNKSIATMLKEFPAK